MTLYIFKVYANTDIQHTADRYGRSPLGNESFYDRPQGTGSGATLFPERKGGGWSFCVRYLPDVTQSGATGSRAKVDYKQVLTESQFAVFSRLREIRKALANEDGVPAYAVFTDEELAGICRLAELTEKSLATLPGIGEKKIIRYGKSMLKRYHTDNNNHTVQADEIQIGGQG